MHQLLCPYCLPFVCFKGTIWVKCEDTTSLRPLSEWHCVTVHIPWHSSYVTELLSNYFSFWMKRQHNPCTYYSTASRPAALGFPTLAQSWCWCYTHTHTHRFVTLSNIVSVNWKTEKYFDFLFFLIAEMWKALIEAEDLMTRGNPDEMERDMRPIIIHKLYQAGRRI